MGETYTILETTWGWIGIVQGVRGVKKIMLLLPERAVLMERIKQEFPDAVRTSPPLKRLEKEFNNYFAGENVSFTAELDWAGHSPFEIAVWQAAKTIPRGTTRTYRWLSNQIKRPNAQRAVGGALGRNPFPPIIPCHRVVRGDRGLGGFSAPGGIVVKRKLLELEGVMFDQKGRMVG
jgi:methylated-DNA-[protein]-cysteine S-methyltransferase